MISTIWKRTVRSCQCLDEDPTLYTLQHKQQLPNGIGVDDHHETADFIVLLCIGRDNNVLHAQHAKRLQIFGASFILL